MIIVYKTCSTAILAVGLLMFIGFPKPTYAAQASGSYVGLSSHMGHFWQQSSLALQRVMNQPDLQQYTFMLWAGFSFILLANLLMMYMLGGTHIYSIIQSVLMIATVRILMNHFDDITGALWNTSEGIALGIQKATLGTTDLWFASGFIQDVMGSISIDWFSFDFIVQGILVILLYVLCTALSVMAFLASVWSLWGYILAKMIGLFFLPFILFERLSWLFDGWLRFFIGFLVYGILARINVILGVICIKSFLNLPSGQLPTGTSFFYSTDKPDDVITLLCVLAICLAALASSGRFASAIVAGTSGFGYSLRTSINSISKAWR